MECNKDEACRAKEIAENKMMKNDFEGARKVALKAQKLFPELDNISQLLAVCDVHCSAQKKINGSEIDFYGILQVESLADESTIKKQYRKLALVLHPDKNKFPGAESAFKLICEANRILSNKCERYIHDVKCRDSKPQNHQQSKSNGQPPESNSQPPSFWRFCQFCRTKYKYHREHINKRLQCQKCMNHFITNIIHLQFCIF